MSFSSYSIAENSMFGGINGKSEAEALETVAETLAAILPDSQDPDREEPDTEDFLEAELAKDVWMALAGARES